MWHLQNFAEVKKMDEFNYLQFLNDDNELLQVEDVQLGDVPTFSLHFDEFFWRFFCHIYSRSVRSRVQQNRKNENKTTTNPEQTQVVDVSRFPVVSNDAMQELKSVATNKTRPTPQNNG